MSPLSKYLQHLPGCEMSQAALSVGTCTCGLEEAKNGQEQAVKEIASIAWKGAANAHRMYPENKHTFADYWSAAKGQFENYFKPN